eukprot:Blabericola_migrator_1__10497@NODE_594_length_7434_cov_165_100584_g436_i0_p2_GENE_NODE_594_length_7434_cov_165_100584_g436_i0NODE_594_length_7434_cov_165_100584_g436_i0_p2_ORF_typecomplete_len461_score66_87GpcrRhopsn4/PF10192_9/2_9e06Lung_7TM_R/PF06814_13/3_5e05DUF2157/PF09925_9/1_1e04DUF2157/PF09925_9/0_31_NODE_594_length_7434_cov_165_100584_g436_i049156297
MKVSCWTLSLACTLQTSMSSAWFLLILGASAHRLSFESPLGLIYPTCPAIRSSVSKTHDIPVWAPLEYRSCHQGHTTAVIAPYEKRREARAYGLDEFDDMTIWDRLRRQDVLPVSEREAEHGFFEKLAFKQFSGTPPVWLLDGSCAESEFSILLEAQHKASAIIFAGHPSELLQKTQWKKGEQWKLDQMKRLITNYDSRLRGFNLRERPPSRMINSFSNIDQHLYGRLPASYYAPECEPLQRVMALFNHTRDHNITPPLRPVTIETIQPPDAGMTKRLSAYSCWLGALCVVAAILWRAYLQWKNLADPEEFPVRVMLGLALDGRAASLLLSAGIFYITSLNKDGGALLILSFFQILSDVLWGCVSLLLLMVLCKGWTISRSALTEREIGSTMVYVSVRGGATSTYEPQSKTLTHIRSSLGFLYRQYQSQVWRYVLWLSYSDCSISNRVWCHVGAVSNLFI